MNIELGVSALKNPRTALLIEIYVIGVEKFGDTNELI
jgi:hypothetical protein